MYCKPFLTCVAAMGPGVQATKPKRSQEPLDSTAVREYPAFEDFELHVLLKGDRWVVIDGRSCVLACIRKRRFSDGPPETVAAWMRCL